MADKKDKMVDWASIGLTEEIALSNFELAKKLVSESKTREEVFLKAVEAAKDMEQPVRDDFFMSIGEAVGIATTIGIDYYTF